MKAATLRSPRLRRALGVLADCEEHSTAEIVDRAQVVAVKSVVAELRENGIAVASRRVGRTWF